MEVKRRARHLTLQTLFFILFRFGNGTAAERGLTLQMYCNRAEGLTVESPPERLKNSL